MGTSPAECPGWQTAPVGWWACSRLRARTDTKVSLLVGDACWHGCQRSAQTGELRQAAGRLVADCRGRNECRKLDSMGCVRAQFT